MHHGKLDRNTALGLKELRKRITKAKIPSSKLDETINLATWNIREFGKKARLKPSIHFIAEILGQFDLIAVTEVRANIEELKKTLDILGPYWKAVFSDYIADAGGNRERVAYIYDSRAVRFTGLAAEADAPRKKDKKTGEYLPGFSWWRKPFIASFRAGNYDFVLTTAHIRWGKKKEDRIAPLKLLADWVYKRSKEPHGIDKDYIVLGDFNIPKLDDELFKAITSKNLKIPKSLRGLSHGSNLAKDKRYDQILHSPTHKERFTDKAGVVDFYTGGINKLYPGKNLTKHEFTFQLSDHLPLWVQIDTDISGEILSQYLSKRK